MRILGFLLKNNLILFFLLRPLLSSKLLRSNDFDQVEIRIRFFNIQCNINPGSRLPAGKAGIKSGMTSKNLTSVILRMTILTLFESEGDG